MRCPSPKRRPIGFIAVLTLLNALFLSNVASSQGVAGRPGIGGQPNYNGQMGMSGQPGMNGQSGIYGQPGMNGQPGMGQGNPKIPGAQPSYNGSGAAGMPMVNEWRCEKCNAVVGTGDKPPSISNCPSCGVRINGYRDADGTTHSNFNGKTIGAIVGGLFAVVMLAVGVLSLVKRLSAPKKRRKRRPRTDEDDDRIRRMRNANDDNDDDERPRSRTRR